MVVNSLMTGYVSLIFNVQWNPSCKTTLFAPEKWPFKRGGLSSGVKINTFVVRYNVKWPFQKWWSLTGWPLKRGSTVFLIYRTSHCTHCHCV